MSISSQVVDGGNGVNIRVSGRFGFESHEDFRAAYERIPGPGGHYVIDLQGTDRMDSAALGMLLMLREYAGGDEANVAIRNCPSEIRDILEIASFDKMFDVG